MHTFDILMLTLMLTLFYTFKTALLDSALSSFSLSHTHTVVILLYINTFNLIGGVGEGKSDSTTCPLTLDKTGYCLFSKVPHAGRAACQRNGSWGCSSRSIYPLAIKPPWLFPSLFYQKVETWIGINVYTFWYTVKIVMFYIYFYLQFFPLLRAINAF